jgi:hypothetical protein
VWFGSGAPAAFLLDPARKVGRAYGARTTPHMYVINGEGALVYMGGIDNQPTARLEEDLKSAGNFVDEALSEISPGAIYPEKDSLGSQNLHRYVRVDDTEKPTLVSAEQASKM